jgi:beta-glucanase (GH16 family)
MRKIILTFNKLVIATIGYAQLHTPADPHWQQKWMDDFTTQNISYVESGWVLADNYHRLGEPHIFMKNNISVNSTDGLVFTAKKQQSGGYFYTGGLAESYNGSTGDRRIRYGYLQADIKLTDHYGIWPAFWLWAEPSVCGDGSYATVGGNPGPFNCVSNGTPLGSCSSGNPTCDYEEIDIFEMIPGAICSDGSYYGQIHDKNKTTTNIHTSGGSTHVGLISGIDDYTNDYNTYAVEWTSSSINFYINNILVRELLNPNESQLNKINQKLPIFLNISLNNYVRCPPSAFGSCNIYNTSWNQSTSENYFNSPTGAAYTGGPNYPSYPNINTSDAHMYVKNVVYYTLSNTCSTLSDEAYSIMPLHSAYDYIFKKSITISGTSPSSGTAKVFRARDYILLNEGFEFNYNSGDLYLEVSECID